jgi:hypothetical protein
MTQKNLWISDAQKGKVNNKKKQLPIQQNGRRDKKSLKKTDTHTQLQMKMSIHCSNDNKSELPAGTSLLKTSFLIEDILYQNNNVIKIHQNSNTNNNNNSNNNNNNVKILNNNNSSSNIFKASTSSPSVAHHHIPVTAVPTTTTTTTEKHSSGSGNNGNHNNNSSNNGIRLSRENENMSSSITEDDYRKLVHNSERWATRMYTDMCANQVGHSN